MILHLNLKKINIFYNFNQNYYSDYVKNQIKIISEKNNFEIISFPEVQDFDKQKIVLKILQLIHEKNKEQPKNFIILTNCIDVLLEFSNMLILSFVSSDNVKLYLKQNKIPQEILVTPNLYSVYEVNNSKKEIEQIEVGYFGIKSNKLKSYVSNSSKRYNELLEIFESYSQLNKEFYILKKLTKK
jgi:hypothetical protein